jgi:hypothetical protein
MQFIEKSWLGVRSAVYHLKHDEDGPEFILFPMVHVGSREFYAEVSRQLADCDLILAEGVASRKANLLTLSYRVVRRIKRMDLVTQREGLNTKSLRDRILRVDMTGRAFDERWSALPWKLRMQLYFFLPVFVAYMFLRGTRAMLAEHLALEDLPSREEVLEADESFAPLDALVIDERDRQLVRSLEEIYLAKQQTGKKVGVLYGARHMRCAADYLLHTLNYRVAKAEWVTVFYL